MLLILLLLINVENTLGNKKELSIHRVNKKQTLYEKNFFVLFFSDMKEEPIVSTARNEKEA